MRTLIQGEEGREEEVVVVVEPGTRALDQNGEAMSFWEV